MEIQATTIGYNPTGNIEETPKQPGAKQNDDVAALLKITETTIDILQNILGLISKAAAQNQPRADHSSKDHGVPDPSLKNSDPSGREASPISSVKFTASTTNQNVSQMTDEQKNIMESAIHDWSAANGKIAGIYSHNDVEKMFSQTLESIQEKLGRQLTPSETKQLFDETADLLIYDNANRANDNPTKDNRLGLEGIKNQVIAEWTSPAPEPKPLNDDEKAAINAAAKAYGMNPDDLCKVIQDIDASASKKTGTEVHIASPDKQIMEIANQLTHHAYTTIDDYVNRKAIEVLSAIPTAPGTLNGDELAAIKQYAAKYGLDEDKLSKAVQEMDKQASADAGAPRHLADFQVANVAFRLKNNL